MSGETQSWIPGHPQPTPEQVQREEQIRNAFLVLGKTLQPILENLPRGTKVLTLEKKIQGFHYRLTLSPIAEEK